MSEQEASSGRKGDVHREWTQFGGALALVEQNTVEELCALVHGVLAKTTG